MEDELDLRAYAEVVWRGRWIVTAITLGAALAALVISRFVLRPVYEATVLLVVEATELQRLDRSAAPAPVGAVSLSPLGFKEIVESPPFQALLLENTSSQKGEAPKPPGKVKARVVPQTNLLELRAESADPTEAARQANQAAALLLREAERVNQDRMQRALLLLEQQIASARASLDEAVRRLQEFTRRGRLVEQLQNEQSAKLKLIADYQTRLADLEVRQAAEQTKLSALEANLSQQPAVLSLKKALSPEGSVLAQVISGLGVKTGEPLMNLQDEQLNPVHVQLQQQIAAQKAALAALRTEEAQIRSALARLNEEVQRLTSELVRLQAEHQELTWQADMARRNYEAAVTQYEAQKTALASRLGESTLTLVRPAVAPDRPSRPRPLLNATAAGFLGFMLSVFGLLIAEFWRQPAHRPESDVAHGPSAVGR